MKFTIHALTILGTALAFAACSDDSGDGAVADDDFVGGGGSGPTLSLADYDKSCSSEADCAAVFEGPVCGCACPNHAINVSELDRYNARQQELSQSCGRPTVACSCAGGSTVCAGGTCDLTF